MHKATLYAARDDFLSEPHAESSSSCNVEGITLSLLNSLTIPHTATICS
jgi:hypothetical protein